MIIPTKEQLTAAQKWIAQEEEMRLWPASLAQLLAEREAKLRATLERILTHSSGTLYAEISEALK